MKSSLQNIFLPKKNMSKHYLKYMKWSFVSNVLVSIQTAMSTHSMLNVVSDPEGEAYRTINYIGKDVIGQVSALVYMSHMSDKSDSKPMHFLVYSNLIQQTSFIMLSVTPLMSHSLFLPLAGVSNLMSNVSFTGYGAINAKCIQSMSNNNTGEIYSKITTLNTLASSIGLGIGIGVCLFLPEHEIRIGLLPIIGMARVYTYNKAVEDLIKL